ncbi:unnamed protein product [Pleuronectes platessa]|uniref:Uncharacterized protein n=1 Tax=Pleuronectes platessa TaxID=8262 RepID=A0A9N7ZE76_PLEPL|nr:unnamed protein product [Pleuronectes platessa]
MSLADSQAKDKPPSPGCGQTVQAVMVRPLTAVRGAELQAIKSELTQIKTNIEALLGRLEQITEDAHITATELRKADECKHEEAWQEGEESSSELDDEEEEQRQNSEAEEEEEEDEEEEEEGEHTQDDAQDHMVRVTPVPV